MIAALPLLIGSTFLLRVILGILYMIIYKLKTNRLKKPRSRIEKNQSPQKRINIDHQN
jgi:hypothetical protein